MKTVVGVFIDRDEADRAVKALEAEGYKPEDMSVVVREGSKGGQATYAVESTVAEGVSAGAVTGGAIGGLAGLLIGVGALAIPGIGALFIAGPIAAALGLTGAAATTLSGAITGALAGGLIGALTSVGIPERDARYYEEKIKDGGVLLLVSVEESGDISVVEDIYHRNNAEEVRTLEPAHV